MPNFNQVVIAGTLGQDPQVRYTSGGSAVCEISMAINRQWFDKTTNQKKEAVTWVPVVLWGRTAEIAGEYLKKGSHALIGGRLEESTWTDKDSGQKRSKLKVVCESMQFIGSKQDVGKRQESSGEGSQAPPETQSSYNPEEVPF